jgi:hypothetical protein
MLSRLLDGIARLLALLFRRPRHSLPTCIPDANERGPLGPHRTAEEVVTILQSKTQPLPPAGLPPPAAEPRHTPSPKQSSSSISEATLYYVSAEWTYSINETHVARHARNDERSTNSACRICILSSP